MSADILILPEPTVCGQALLFSPEIENHVRTEESKGVYTAERFKAQRPDAYKAVIQLLGADVGLQRIGKLLGIHHLTAAAVRDLEPEAIDTVRSKMVTKLRTAVLLQVERLIEHPESVPMNVTGLIIAQLIDKAELLDGRATQRVERTERVDIYANWNETVEKLLDPSRVVEIEPGIGLDAGNVSAIGEPDAGNVSAIGEPGEGDPASLDRAASDEESLTQSDIAQDNAPTATTTDTDPRDSAGHPGSPAGPPAAWNQGGEGVSLEEGGPGATIDSNARKFSDNGLRAAHADPI